MIDGNSSFAAQSSIEELLDLPHMFENLSPLRSQTIDISDILTVASSYQVQIGLPMGNLHSDRDTTIHMDATHSIQIQPSSIKFFNVSLTSHTEWTMQWDAASSNVIFILTGLRADTGYSVNANGVRLVDIHTDSAGVLTFSYTGHWSQITFDVELGSIQEGIDIIVSALPIIIMIAFVASFIPMLVRLNKTKK